MTTEQFEKMLTPELIKKLHRIAWGVLHDWSAAEDAVQLALLRILGRLKSYRKITPSFLASRVVMICGEKRKNRASNAFRETPCDERLLEVAEREARSRMFGRRVPQRRPGDPVPGPTDLWRP